MNNNFHPSALAAAVVAAFLPAFAAHAGYSVSVSSQCKGVVTVTGQCKSSGQSPAVPKPVSCPSAPKTPACPKPPVIDCPGQSTPPSCPGRPVTPVCPSTTGGSTGGTTGGVASTPEPSLGAFLFALAAVAGVLALRKRRAMKTV